jgi:hypothetical protein
MTKKRTQNPTVDTMVSVAIERRKAGKPPASAELTEDDEAEVKAEKPVANKARKAAPANKGVK